LSLEELKKIYLAKSGLTDEEIKKRFNELDIDKDGYLSNRELMMGFASASLKEDKLEKEKKEKEEKEKEEKEEKEKKEKEKEEKE